MRCKFVWIQFMDEKVYEENAPMTFETEDGETVAKLRRFFFFCSTDMTISKGVFYPEPQKRPNADFLVVEWGGMEIDASQMQWF